MKLKFLPIVLLALSFAACDTYEETDDVANQRAEQEAFVKAENLKDAYSEYTSAYIDWSSKSNSFTEIEKTINKYKQSLILLETGYDEATVKAMKESDKAQYETELTLAQARLEVLETADVDVKLLKTKIEAIEQEVLDLGDNENIEIYYATITALNTWNTKYNEGVTSTFIYGRGYDADIWEEKAIVTKNNLSIAVEPLKIELDKADKILADSKEVYDAALEAYITAKTARDEAKAIYDAAQADFDAAQADFNAADKAVTDAETSVTDAETAYATVASDENKNVLDSAKENAVVAKATLIKAEADLTKATDEYEDAKSNFITPQNEYSAAEISYETVTVNYEKAKKEQRIRYLRHRNALSELNNFNIETLKAELIELNATYAAAYKIKGKIGSLKAQKAELENTMFFIEANFSDVSGTEEYIENNISAIESDIKVLESNIAELDKDLAKIAAGIYNLSRDYYGDLTATQIQEAIASFEAKLVASNELIAAAKAQLNRAKAAYEALLAEYTEKSDDETSSDE